MSKKKVFFHLEAQGDTYSKSLFLRAGQSSAAEVAQAFSVAFQLDHPELPLGRVQVTDSAGNVFRPDDDLFSLLQSRDDCYIVRTKKLATPPEGDNQQQKEASSKEPLSNSKEKVQPPLPSPSFVPVPDQSTIAKSNDMTLNSISNVEYKQLMSKVDEFLSQKALRKARDICLTIISDKNYEKDARVMEHLCHIYFQCKKYEDVIKYGELALSGFSKTREKIKKNSENVSFLLTFLAILQEVSRSQSALGEHEDALERIMQGLILLRNSAQSTPLKASNVKLSLLPASVFDTVCSSPRNIQAVVLETAALVDMSDTHGKSQKNSFITFELDFKADLTSCLFILGRHEEAGAVVNALIGHPSSSSHMLSLLVYAEIAAAYNKIPEAVQGAMKAVVLDSAHTRCKALTSKLLSSEAGLQEVYKLVPPVAQAAAAYSFLANVAKDMSCLDTAETLMRQVVKLDVKKDATHFLGLVHVLEGKLDLKGALNTVILAIRSQQRRSEYVDSGGSGADFFPGTTVNRWCADFVELLDEAIRSIGDRSDERKSQHKPVNLATNTSNQDLYVCFIKKNADSADSSVLSSTGKASSGTQQRDGDYAIVLPLSCTDYSRPSTDLKSATDVAFDIDVLKRGPEKADKEFSNNVLDILALAFTSVKLLFLLGQLGTLPRLVGHVEWARRASKKPLHETNIRNEHAYYLCIVQILAFYTTPANTDSHDTSTSYLQNRDHSPFSNKLVLDNCGNNGDKKFDDLSISPVYVCGDSHVLSSAYTVLKMSPTDRKVLVPKLVTGVKQWHLRKQSNFYTKDIFHRTMSTVPDESEVIFLIGEIDCREGILVAVEKGMYKDVEEGMCVTIAIFKEVVQSLIVKKKLKVFIHPIIPVLDVTRHIVHTFNNLYKKAMSGIAGCHWLDIEGSFVDTCGDISLPGSGGKVLRDDLKLDGTHVHPRYVSLLEAEMRRVCGTL